MSRQPFPNDPTERSESEHDASGSTLATTVRQEGSEAVGETQRQAQDVLRRAGDRTADVIDEARHEVRDVVDEARAAISREADERTRHTGGALAPVADGHPNRLRSMKRPQPAG